MFVFKTMFAMGNDDVKLPLFLTNNALIVCFDKRYTGRKRMPYKNNLCTFMPSLTVKSGIHPCSPI